MKKNSEKVDSLASKLRDQIKDLRIGNTYDLLRTSAILNNYLHFGYKEINMKQNQVILLCFLLASGGTMTPTELKRKIFRTDNAISHALDNLDKLGLTRSSGSKSDRRIRRVTLTDKGLDTLNEILPVRYELFTKATGCLTEEEAKTLRSLLEKIKNHLVEILEDRQKPEAKS